MNSKIPYLLKPEILANDVTSICLRLAFSCIPINQYNYLLLVIFDFLSNIHYIEYSPFQPLRM
jgi:hypothetical protein